MAEARVLRGDLAPQVPAAALLQLGLELGGGILAAEGRVLDTAAVRDKDEVVLGQVDGIFLPIVEDVDAGGLLFAAGTVEGDVRDLGVIVELNAEALQVLDHGQDHRLVLVVAGEAQRRKVGQTADVVDVALQIALHLQRTVPVLKGEHRAPVHPEIGVQDFVVEEVGDLLVVQLLIGGHEQVHDLHGGLVGQTELAVGVGILAAVAGGAAEAVVGVSLVQPVVLIQNGVVLVLDGGDGAKQVPHALKVVVHLTAAAHDVADILIFVAVAGAAGNGILLQNMDMLALHLGIAHQVAGRGQRRQAGTDEIGRFAVNVGGLFWGGKGFIVTAGIIHNVPPVSVYGGGGCRGRCSSSACPRAVGCLVWP